MAMRPRPPSGVIRAVRPANQPVYEDFRPLSEWKQEQGADILLIHLPGFMGEQIRVTSEPSNIIKGRGERLVANNRWSRFNQDYRIPENCNVRGIFAKFDGGILSITMPKKIVQSQPPQAAKTTQQPPSTPKPTTSLETPSPKSSTMEPKPENSPDDRKNTVDTPSPQVTKKDSPKFQGEESAKTPSPKEMKTIVDALSIPDTLSLRKNEGYKPKSPKAIDDGATEFLRETVDKQEKNYEGSTPKKASTEPKLQKIVEDTKTIVDTLIQKTKEHKLKSPKSKDDDATESEKSGRETVEKQKEKGAKIYKGSTPGAEFIKKFLDKRSDDDANGDRGKDKAKEHKPDAEKITRSTSTGGEGGDQLENFNKIVKGFAMKIKEDRGSVVNMGVAVLVIVALGVYMSYTKQ